MKTICSTTIACFLLGASLLAQVSQTPASTGRATDLSAAAIDALSAVAPTGVPVEMLSTNGQSILRVLLLGQPVSTITGNTPAPLATGSIGISPQSGQPICTTLPSSAIAWWPGEGDASDRFARSPGTPQNGVSYTSGKVSQAFSFASVSDQAVEIPPTALATANFSVEAWVNPSSQIGGNGQAWVFGQSYGRQMVVRNDGYNPNGLIVAWAVSTSRWPFYEVDSTIDIPIGAWSHLVGTWDGTNLRLYTNGALCASAALNITPWDSGCPFHIGGVYDPTGDCQYTGQFFNGLIDEVTYYNTALTTSEVSALYSAGTAGKCFTYTLAYHMATNAVGHSLGHTDIDLATKEVINPYPYTSWNPECWLLGVDGLSATSIGWSNGIYGFVYGYPVVTMVSPRHFLYAWHTHPESDTNGGFEAFLGTDSVVHFARILEGTNLLNGDLAVGILDTSLPSSVGYLPVLDPNYSTYLPTGNQNFVQGIGGKSVYSQPRVFSQPIGLWDASNVYWSPTAEIIPLGFGLGTDWSQSLITNDSSSPQRFLINNQLVLLSAAYYSTFGPNYANYIDAIQDAMNDLTRTHGGNYYTLQTYLLTGWPNIQ